MGNDDSSIDKATIVVIAVIIGIGGILFALPYILGSSVPMGPVGSSSMVPELVVGDLVLVQGRAPETIKVGEVIVFKPEGWALEGVTVVIHRVINIYHDDNGTLWFVTRGDNVNRPDPKPTPGQNIYGVAFVKIRYLGYFILWISGREYIVATVFISCLISVAIGLMLIVRGVPSKDLIKLSFQRMIAKIQRSDNASFIKEEILILRKKVIELEYSTGDRYRIMTYANIRTRLDSLLAQLETPI